MGTKDKEKKENGPYLLWESKQQEKQAKKIHQGLTSIRKKNALLVSILDLSRCFLYCWSPLVLRPFIKNMKGSGVDLLWLNNRNQ